MAFDLQAYLDRIGYVGRPGPDMATLAALHRAHVDAIPFENLEIQMGRPVPLDIEALVAKMVMRRRGGYCFEQNALFARALERIGFESTPREARVRQGAAGAVRPRTHMVLTLACGGREWLADVGFGGDGLVQPLALDGTASVQMGVTYRVSNEGSLRVLQRLTPDGWEDLYAVHPDAVHPVDFEVANWYTSTHPRSAFVLNVTAQRITADTRHILRNLSYSTVRMGVVETRALARPELVPLLGEAFGLDVPGDARFLALDGQGRSRRA